jgi:hypothetical protein
MQSSPVFPVLGPDPNLDSLRIGKIRELDHVHDIITSPPFFGFPFATSR